MKERSERCFQTVRQVSSGSATRETLHSGSITATLRGVEPVTAALLSSGTRIYDLGEQGEERGG